MGTLKTHEWKTREWKKREDSARVEITGVENVGGDCRVEITRMETREESARVENAGVENTRRDFRGVNHRSGKRGKRLQQVRKANSFLARQDDCHCFQAFVYCRVTVDV